MRKIIMDVDTGTDDATAIIAAMLSSDIDLLGICTVGGNRSVDKTTRHTLMVAELVGKEIPVYAGCPGPITKGLYKAPKNDFKRTGRDENGKEFGYHDDFELPEPVRKAEKTHAVTYLVETLRNTKEKITIVGTGPMTNIGMALRIAPDIAKNVEEFVLMAGGINETNITSAAEGNVFNDPEAMAIIMNSGAKITIMPLDATHEVALPKEYIDKCKSFHTPVADFFAEMLFQRIRVYNALQPLKRTDVAPIHDALCIAYLIDPTVIDDMRNVHLDVCLDHNEGRGQFIVDTRFYHDKPNCFIAYSGKCELFGEILMNLLREDALKRNK